MFTWISDGASLRWRYRLSRRSSARHSASQCPPRVRATGSVFSVRLLADLPAPDLERWPGMRAARVA